MALTFNNGEEDDMATVTVDRRLYLDDEGNLVEKGDPDAAFLWAAEGAEVSDAAAEEVGYEPAPDSEDPQDESDTSADTAEETSDEEDTDADAERPPEGGVGSGRDAWVDYYRALTGEDPPEDASRDDIIDLIDSEGG